MNTNTKIEHSCHGAVFCGQPRDVAERDCDACVSELHDEAQRQLQQMPTSGLLRSAYSLTHTLHRLDSLANERTTPRELASDARTQGALVRAQRDLIDAEIERRTR